jgi:hypothetical protein
MTVSLSATVVSGQVDFMIVDLDVTNACIVTTSVLPDGTVQSAQYELSPARAGSSACVQKQLGLTAGPLTAHFVVPGGHTYLLVYDSTSASSTGAKPWEVDAKPAICSPDKRVTYTSAKGCPTSPATVNAGAVTKQSAFICDGTFDTQGDTIGGTCAQAEAGKGQCNTDTGELEFCPADASGPRTFDCGNLGQCLDWHGTVGCVTWSR